MDGGTQGKDVAPATDAEKGRKDNMVWADAKATHLREGAEGPEDVAITSLILYQIRPGRREGRHAPSRGEIFGAETFGQVNESWSLPGRIRVWAQALGQDESISCSLQSHDSPHSAP